MKRNFLYVMHRGGGIPPELPDSQVTSLFVRFSLIVTLLNLFLSLGTEIHVTSLLSRRVFNGLSVRWSLGSLSLERTICE